MLEFEIKKAEPTDKRYIDFLKIWENEIERIFPNFDSAISDFFNIYLIVINDAVSGIFVFQEKGVDLEISVDFMVPEYRDQGVGKLFFEEQKAKFREQGFEKLVSYDYNGTHKPYLQMLGFKQHSSFPFRFELSLK